LRHVGLELLQIIYNENRTSKSYQNTIACVLLNRAGFCLEGDKFLIVITDMFWNKHP